MHKVERYAFQGSLETGAAESGPGRLSGYFLKFNTLSSDRGGYRDSFQNGVMANLAEDWIDDGQDVKAYLDHNEGVYLGRSGNASLKIVPDAIGYRFDLSLPDTTVGRDVAALAAGGHFNGMSFGYVPETYSWKQDEAGDPIRLHQRGRLVEVSVVYDPAFRNTNVELNSLGEAAEAVLEDLARWKAEQAATPRLDAAARALRLHIKKF